MSSNPCLDGGPGVLYWKACVGTAPNFRGTVTVTLHRLASFGGAGGQHACEIAGLLGIKTILIHRYSSILSAYGLALADRYGQ